MQRQLRKPIEEELSTRSHHQPLALDLKMQPGFWEATQSFDDGEDDDDEEDDGHMVGGQPPAEAASVASSSENNVHEYWQTNRFGVDMDDENTNEDQPSVKTSIASSSEHEFGQLNDVDYADDDDDGEDLRKESRLDDDLSRHHRVPSNQQEQIVMEVQQTLEQINEFVNQQQQNQNNLSQTINIIEQTSKELANQNNNGTTNMNTNATHHSNLPMNASTLIINSHKPGRRLYKCRHCSFETDKKIENWQHIRIHMRPEKLLCCESCQFVTEYKHHLEYHQRNHTGFKPFKCEHCDYQCVNKSMLNSHMKSHSTIYQFQCGDCKYATKYVHSLKMHLRKYNHQPAQMMIDIYGRKRGPKPGCGGRNSNLKQTSTSSQPTAATSTGNKSSMNSNRAGKVNGKNQSNATNQCVLDLRVGSKLVH